MSITVVGSLAFDTVETPAGRNEEGLGGAGTFFSLAAVNYAPVNLVGVVGDDFPQEHIDLFVRKGVNMEGLERAEGKTFRWAGRYHEDVNVRDTLDTQLGVLTEAGPNPASDVLRPAIDFMVETFGFERLMWGSDWPVCLRAGSYRANFETTIGAFGDLPPDQRDRLLGANAQRFYRIE